MRKTGRKGREQVREIESRRELEQWIEAGGSPEGLVFQSLDLRPFEDWLRRGSLKGAVLLGCRLSRALTERALAQGAMVFPPFEDLPFDAYRGCLYDAETLYAGFDPGHPETYDGTPDGRIWTHYEDCRRSGPLPIRESLARRLHDHAIGDALEELLTGEGERRVVAIMGGHGMSRDSPSYAKVARLARQLTREGFFLASGGGPGAMEATHLGAWFAPRSDGELDLALAVLSGEAAFSATGKRAWLARAMAVRERWPLPEGRAHEAASLGIPTWLYGHEPSNPFATHIAKYFANSVREEGLLEIATWGVIFAPGSAGTIQEVFQDACQNHYVSFGVVSPMVFLDRAYWTERKAVFPLLRELAEGHEYGRWLSIVDEEDEAVEALRRYAEHRLSES